MHHKWNSTYPWWISQNFSLLFFSEINERKVASSTSEAYHERNFWKKIRQREMTFNEIDNCGYRSIPFHSLLVISVQFCQIFFEAMGCFPVQWCCLWKQMCAQWKCYIKLDAEHKKKWNFHLIHIKHCWRCQWMMVRSNTENNFVLHNLKLFKDCRWVS